MKILKSIIVLEVVVLAILICLLYYRQKDTLLDCENVIEVLQETYRTAYISGSNNAVNAINKGISIDKDYVSSHLFKDSVIFFKSVIISK